VIEAVLFDLDGTLADTAPDLARTVNLMLKSRGLAPVALEKVRPHVSKGARGMIVSAFAIGTDHPEYPALRDEFLRLYADNLCVDSRLFPGMESLLAHLEGESIPWGVVTNKFERLARLVIAGLGLGDRAAIVVGGDTCARAKPFPDPLVFAAASMEIAPRNVLYVGDDERDVQAARAAGMPVVVAGYGYLGDGPPPAMWGGDAIVESVADLERWIRDTTRAALERAMP
jgi:N-acetyl-D-muramate 6-phosphate phosphatase